MAQDSGWNCLESFYCSHALFFLFIFYFYFYFFIIYLFLLILLFRDCEGTETQLWCPRTVHIIIMHTTDQNDRNFHF